MNLALGFQVGIKEILAHKFRSLLTMLGVILGVSSLVSMFALTEGMARGMREVLQARGGVETVRIDNKAPSEKVQDFAFLSPKRTMADIEAIRRGAPLVTDVTPESRLNNAAVTAGGTTVRTTATGTLPSMRETARLVLARGRMLSDLDVERAHRVAVLGASIVSQLWPDESQPDPVGRRIFINDRAFTVVGTLALMETDGAKRQRALQAREPKRQRDPGAAPRRSGGGGGGRRFGDPYWPQNNGVFIPITTMFYEFRSALKPSAAKDAEPEPDYELDEISFRVTDMALFDQALAQVTNVLNSTHRGIDDFQFNTREDWFDSIETSVRATRLTGGLIAGISLLVGGIGITNIMLASITERIREIGVRRAVGASGRDIFAQILVESSLIGMLGGLIGLAASGALVRGLELLSPATNIPVVTLPAVLISFGFAAGIGILSGLYPAWKAATLDPIEALRYG